jgi:hypothetical protein
MPTSLMTEDVEFLTGVDTGGNVVRRGRFISRPRRVGGRNVPGNARYYRRRQRELLAGRRAAQRGGATGRASTAAAARRPAARRPAAPAAGQRRSGILSRIRRAARSAARNVESRARSRRERNNRR